ncbi:MAG: hypothetical protein Q4A67_00440 [Aerococcus sp.]|nr:hypothetical protein [Aerococcus sp.]
MNFIYIAPHFPRNFHQFVLSLAEQGVHVLGIGQESYDDLPSAMQTAFVEYFRVRDIQDEEEVTRAVAFLFYRHGVIDCIEALKREYVPFIAQLREQFHVTGAKPREVVRTQSRAKMSDYFKKAGIPHLSGVKVRTSMQLMRALKGRDFPISLMNDDVNNQEPLVLVNQEQVEAFINDWSQQTEAYFVLDDVVSGETYYYQGLADHNGAIVYEKLVHQLPLNKNGLALFEILPTLPAELRTLAHQAQESFKTKTGFFTLTFEYQGGQWIAVTFSTAPLAGLFVDALNFTDDRDLYMNYAQVVTHTALTASSPTAQMGLLARRAVDFPSAIPFADIKEQFAHELRFSQVSADQENYIFVTTDSATKQAIVAALTKKA